MVPDYEKDQFVITKLLLDKYAVGKDLKNNHNSGTLERCRNIWCRDFMPIQVGNGFVQFIYAPEDLVEDEGLWSEITLPGMAYQPWLLASDAGPWTVRVVPLVLDGGSIVGDEHFAFVSERIFKDNPGYSPSWFRRVLGRELSVQHVEFIPEMPPTLDFTGHIDGSLRVVSKNQVVVGMPAEDGARDGDKKYFQATRDYGTRLKAIAKAAGFCVIELVDVSYRNRPKGVPEDSVWGSYANFLQLGRKLIVPKWGIEEDRVAREQLEDEGFLVEMIDAGDFAKEKDASGGAINCVTWNWQSYDASR